MSQNDYDVTKKMLNVLRDKNVKSSQNINEVSSMDQTRKILEILRENKTPKKLLENSDVIQLEGSELKAEQDKFRDVIGQRVEFNVFNIYPAANNVVFGGKFQDLDGAEWQFSLEEDDGVYLTTNNMKLTSAALEKLQRLRGYYENWSEEWAQKLATEYRQNI